MTSNDDHGDGLDVMTVHEAAQEARVHDVTIYRLIREGRLKAARCGRVLRVRRADLIALFTTDGGDDA